jgi:hypothetical protein
VNAGAARRVAGLAVGLVFGVVLSWSGMASPVVIRQALLFQRAYLFLFFASAVIVATAGSWLLRRAGTRTLIGGEPIAWPREAPHRRHIVGSVVFGIGWGIADACPGPIATQLGQGAWWGLWTLAGVVLGVWLYLHSDAPETEPAREPSPSAAPAGSG